RRPGPGLGGGQRRPGRDGPAGPRRDGRRPRHGPGDLRAAGPPDGGDVRRDQPRPRQGRARLPRDRHRPRAATAVAGRAGDVDRRAARARGAAGPPPHGAYLRAARRAGVVSTMVGTGMALADFFAEDGAVATASERETLERVEELLAALEDGT